MSYVKACASSELENEKGKCVVLGGKKIAIFRANGTILAVDDTCTHDEASLAEGTVLYENDRCVVECPWHGAHFDLCTGTAVTFPAVTPVGTYSAREVDGSIEIDVV
ncbi:MAG: non-heme iron oxygenase ferredoxin subunit [Planctomycetota bacterium]